MDPQIEMTENAVRKNRYRIIVFLLISFMAVRLFLSMRNATLVTDEFVHIPAGYLYLKVHNFSFNPEHPPLIKMLAGLPLMILNPPLPADPGHAQAWNRWFKFSMDFLFLSDAKSREVITWARTPMILVSCLLAGLIFIWSKKAFGIAAGIFSLLLYTMEPNILAFSRIVYTDIGASLAYLAFFYCVWQCAKLPVFRNVLWVILAAGVSLLVKHSMIILLPACLVFLAGMVVARRISVRKGLVYVILAFLLSLSVLNLAYGFHSHAFNSQDLKTVAAWFHLDTSNCSLNSYLDRYSFVPIPEDWLLGLDVVVNHNRQGHPAFLMGRFSPTGWWYYFPVAFFFKTPIPFLVLAILGLAWLTFEAVFHRNSTAAFLLVPLVLYGAVAMSSQINIGLRHILPMFPFLFIAAGGLFQFLWEKRSIARWAVLALGIGLVVNSLAIRYDYLEYFNEFAGGPDNGWRYLGESNIDGGQNFLRVAEYLKRIRPEKAYLYIIGVEYPVFAGMPINLFLPEDLDKNFRQQFPFSYRVEFSSLKPGVYFIGVCRMLDPYTENSSHNEGDLARGLSLRRFTGIPPDAKIGHVIWVYNLTAEKIARLGLSDMQFFYFNNLEYRRSD